MRAAARASSWGESEPCDVHRLFTRGPLIARPGPSVGSPSRPSPASLIAGAENSSAPEAHGRTAVRLWSGVALGPDHRHRRAVKEATDIFGTRSRALRRRTTRSAFGGLRSISRHSPSPELRPRGNRIARRGTSSWTNTSYISVDLRRPDPSSTSAWSTPPSIAHAGRHPPRRDEARSELTSRPHRVRFVMDPPTSSHPWDLHEQDLAVPFVIHHASTNAACGPFDVPSMRKAPSVTDAARRGDRGRHRRPPNADLHSRRSTSSPGRRSPVVNLLSALLASHVPSPDHSPTHALSTRRTQSRMCGLWNDSATDARCRRGEAVLVGLLGTASACSSACSSLGDQRHDRDPVSYVPLATATAAFTPLAVWAVARSRRPSRRAPASTSALPATE